jgi:hypothetical protein
VQGQLRQEYLSVDVETSCKHCDQVLHLTVDSQMQISVREADANPLVFMPDIDWDHFTQRTIIYSY